MPFLTVFFFGGEGSPTKYRLQKKVGTLILTSLLEDLVNGEPRAKWLVDMTPIEIHTQMVVDQ